LSQWPQLIFFSLDARAQLVLFHSLRHNHIVKFTVETEQETDGRWLAEVPQIPGAMAYGTSREEAIARVEALGLRVLAERIEQGESSPEIDQVFSVAAA
jgi:predicted RNase H-like HicB family nuclease